MGYLMYRNRLIAATALAAIGGVMTTWAGVSIAEWASMASLLEQCGMFETLRSEHVDLSVIGECLGDIRRARG